MILQLVKQLIDGLRKKVPPSLAVLAAGVGIALLVVVEPVLRTAPVLEVDTPGGVLPLALQGSFSTARVAFETRVTVTFVDMESKGVDGASRIQRESIEASVSEVTFRSLPTSGAGELTRVRIGVPGMVAVRIIGYEVDDIAQRLGSSSRIAFVGTNARLERTRNVLLVIREVLRAQNATVGNFAISLMAVACAWLFILIGYGVRDWIWARSDSDGYVNRKLKELGVDVAQEFSVEAASMCWLQSYNARLRRFQYYQLLGPAFGFLLTMSSLAVGLEPTFRQSGGDLNAFFAALQLAIISSVLGLVIRIEAVILTYLAEEVFVSASAWFEVRTNETPAGIAV